MQSAFTLGLVQETWHPDPKAHARALRRGALKAAAEGARLICLQELTLHRYFGDELAPKNFDLAEPLGKGPSSRLFARLAKESGAHVIGSLFEVTSESKGREDALGLRRKHYYNTAAIFDPQGKLCAFTRKQHIPSGTGYEETFYFEPGDSNYPVHDLGFVKLAVPTCYDQWFPEMARICALKGAELIVYPTAIGSEPNYAGFDSQPRWQTVMTAHAIANGVFVAAVNRTGDEGTVAFYGSSFVCDPTGVVMAQAPRGEPAVVVATLKPEVFNTWRAMFPLLRQRQPHTYGELVRVA